MPLPPDETVVSARTIPSLEYDRPAKAVRGKLKTRKVPALGYTQCWVNGVQVDPDSVAEEAAEDTQLVTVHRDGKTFQERRKKGKVRNAAAKVKEIAQRVHQRAAELAVKLTPAAMKLGNALGVIFDTPEDMKKFGYNPSTSSGGSVVGHDPMRDSLNNAFGVGVSGHIVASIAANVLSRVFVAVKKRVQGREEAGDPYLELGGFIEQVYDMIFDELKLEGDRPKAADIADKLRKLLKEHAPESAGLVEKKIAVHRDGKVIMQKRMVRVGSPTVHSVNKLAKDPHGDKAALQKFAEIAPTEDAKEAVLDAEYNVPKGDSQREYTPQERRVYTAERLGASWRDTLERGDKESAAYLEEIMGHFDMELHGPKPGEEVEFNGAHYEGEEGQLSGPAKVVRQPVVVNVPDGRQVVTKGKAVRA